MLGTIRMSSSLRPPGIDFKGCLGIVESVPFELNSTLSCTGSSLLKLILFK